MSTELVEITSMSPEGLEIANAYLMNGSDTQKAAEDLQLSPDIVHQWLKKPEIRNYIDSLYFESGFRNRNKIGAVMDALISSKLEEMDETGMGTSMDIADLIKLQHSIKMKEMEMQIKLMEAETKAKTTPIINQTNNVQNNISGGANYDALLERIIN